MSEWMILACVVILIGLTNTLQTPKYSVVDKNMNQYEERSYPKTMWACTTDENHENLKGMFLRLFYFMQGANHEGRTIEMTAPLLRHNKADGNVSLMLYLPNSLHDKPPMPTDPAVNITFLPERNYVVRYAFVHLLADHRLFGGFATDEIWMEELEKLKEMVMDDGNVTVDESFYASYSGLHDVIDRRNEIWLIREAEDETIVAQE